MTVSLPEDRARMGKVPGLDEGPVLLTPDDTQLQADKDKALKVNQGEAFFSNTERDRILARLFLQI